MQYKSNGTYYNCQTNTISHCYTADMHMLWIQLSSFYQGIQYNCHSHLQVPSSQFFLYLAGINCDSSHLCIAFHSPWTFPTSCYGRTTHTMKGHTSVHSLPVRSIPNISLSYFVSSLSCCCPSVCLSCLLPEPNIRSSQNPDFTMNINLIPSLVLTQVAVSWTSWTSNHKNFTDTASLTMFI